MSDDEHSQLSTLNSPLIPPGYKQTEVGVIPVDWESTTVSEIASPIRNAIVGGPFGSDLVSTDYVEEGVPVIRGQNMGTKHVSGSFVFVTQAKANSLEANLARPGDLVFTQRGTLGQVSLVPDWPYDRYLVSQSQMKLTVNLKVADPHFFYYVFSSSDQQESIRQNTVQTGVPHINLGILRSIPVQRPPLAEQEAIAEVLSDADALIASLEQLITKKRQIKQGAMQELLTGKKCLPGFGGEWSIVRMREILTQNATYGIVTAGAFVQNGIKMLRGGDIADGRVNTDLPMVSREKASEYRRTTLVKNDIVIALVGYPGEAAKIPEELIGANISRAVGLLRLNSRVSPNYLVCFLNSRNGRQKVLAPSAGSAQQVVNLAALNKLGFSIPELEEQTAIASILSDMDAEIAALEEKLAKARQLKQGMMQELLTGKTRLVESSK